MKYQELHHKELNMLFLTLKYEHALSSTSQQHDQQPIPKIFLVNHPGKLRF